MVFNEYVKVRDEKFGSVIFETLKEKVYVTNGTGKDILALLKEGHTIEEITDFLVDMYDEGRVLVERDVKDFIDTLLNNGLVSDADTH